ncbi:unnamed protein product [Camellia sinensis]
MAEIGAGVFLWSENHTDDDDIISGFPHDFKSYVKKQQLLYERAPPCNWGWLFWSGEDDPRQRPPPSPSFSVEKSMEMESCVPPGFRFHPTEEELVGYYLKQKINSLKIDLDVIIGVDWDMKNKVSGFERQGCAFKELKEQNNRDEKDPSLFVYTINPSYINKPNQTKPKPIRG